MDLLECKACTAKCPTTILKMQNPLKTVVNSIFIGLLSLYFFLGIKAII
jgi:ferredoxin